MIVLEPVRQTKQCMRIEAIRVNNNISNTIVIISFFGAELKGNNENRKNTYHDVS